MDSLQSVKQRFGIIGNNTALNRSLEKAMRVSITDISVLVIGESGVGKENIPKIIHQYSHRKHSKYIAVNCGAIPEGTIDSELFGHEKGAFTGATQTRSGYFEVADGGTIFLDEVGELPLPTQVRLLRVLETGEFIKVGSSKVQKTNARIVAATNVNMMEAIDKGKFREDLYYRLSTVEITLPPLRDRKEDIVLLFRKFASDFAQKYHMPALQLDEHAQALLTEYRWSGNIRQLRNVAEQLSVLEQERNINAAILRAYLPDRAKQLPALIGKKEKESDFSSEREILYKVLFDMKNDLNDLKKLTLDLMKNGASESVQEKNQGLIDKIYGKTPEDSEETELDSLDIATFESKVPEISNVNTLDKYAYAETIEEEEPLSLQAKELEMIKQALLRCNGKRKLAAKELGISERTLYRKIKQYDLQDVETK
jgi:transcriptional regulator with PAS, ATPase and Fis domain